MPTAVLVLLLGCGLTALGVVTPTMYDVGIMVISIGAVGVAVRLIEALRRFRT